MLTNIDSILTKKMARTYSWVLFLLSFLCIGINIIHVILYCLQARLQADSTNEIGEKFILGNKMILTGTKIFCLTDGIWSGTMGLILAFICNLIWYEKMSIRPLPMPFETTEDHLDGHVSKKQDRVFQLEALLFLSACFVTGLSLIGVYLSGLSIIYEMFQNIEHVPKIESSLDIGNALYWSFCAQTGLILVLCLTSFSLTIYSFNVLLPLFYSSLFRLLIAKVKGYTWTVDNESESQSRNSKRSSGGSSRNFANSFSDSSVQFGTIRSLSDTSIASLKRQLSEIRDRENGLPTSRTSSRKNSRSDLILL